MPVIAAPSVAGSGRQAATTSRGDTHASPTCTGTVDDSPSWCSVRSVAITDEPSPYLKVTRSRTSTHRGMRSTSSCSTLTHSSGPMPAGKSNTSGSLNGGVVNQPRSRSHTTGGLRHSSMSVQIENGGANSWPSTCRSAPSRTPSSSIRENRWSAA